MEQDIEFWRLRKVIEKVGFSRSEIYRRMGAGAFPKSKPYPNYQGRPTSIRYWLSTEVRAWQTAAMAEAAPDT